jgi:hypothetical protein
MQVAPMEAKKPDPQRRSAMISDFGGVEGSSTDILVDDSCWIFDDEFAHDLEAIYGRDCD